MNKLARSDRPTAAGPESAGRSALVVVIALVTAVFVVGGTVGVAQGQVPGVDIDNGGSASPSPSPSPSPTPSPSPAPTPTGDPGDDAGGGGSDGGNGSSGRDVGGDIRRKHPREDGEGQVRRGRKGAKGKRTTPVIGFYRPGGSHSTDLLVGRALQLRALGWSTQAISRRVYAPFIIGGRAAWTNTWGAPRYGPATGQVRTHEGQDVFCDFGEPVIASEAGTIGFGEARLGGKVARLYRPDGSYWYYAHLSDWNLAEFSSGDAVEPGDIIGYCGNSGNALTTPPHVHFGWYQGNGGAKNPFWSLVRWLRTAERRTVSLIDSAERRRLSGIDALTLRSRFGDDFTASLVELDPARAELAARLLEGPVWLLPTPNGVESPLPLPSVGQADEPEAVLRDEDLEPLPVDDAIDLDGPVHLHDAGD